MESPTQRKVQQHNFDPVVEMLKRIGLTIVDDENLRTMLETNVTLERENRVLRIRLARRNGDTQ
ncbi:hypothetical protein [Alicyclobacillus fastidiosus]|uniref:Uncharacterized protein n=1 Tax=Alicyclobacillus fastidiosus TaxID=392011 RepID=A0ABV5ALF9_9BACL|nr:hypothetical protein [Alicyclobacillus fastidiosus]WEH11077.1 hypothetical protein PYS47_07625 [Alicyclobacillus fastidiosus]